MGLTVFILVLFYIQFEFSFDKFHKNSENIYRLLQNQDHYFQGKNQAAVTPGGTAKLLKENFPEIDNACRIYQSDIELNFNTFTLSQNQSFYADTDFLRIFDFPLLHGDKNTALSSPNAIIISKDIAEKYFPNKNILGTRISRKNGNDLVISGVMKKLPNNSSLQFDCLISFKTHEQEKGVDYVNQMKGNMNYHTFLLLNPNCSVNKLTSEIDVFLNEYKLPFITNIQLQNIKDMHFHNDALFDLVQPSRIQTIFLFVSISVLILLVAIFNYINFSTARATIRANEIVIKKILGASRKNLIIQFIGEALVFSFLAFIISIIIVNLLIPYFNSFLITKISFQLNFQTLLMLLSIPVLTGLISGIYPAFFLSSNDLVKSLRKNQGVFRKALVISQIFITASLILCALIFFSQMNYIAKKQIGFEKENIINIHCENHIPNPNFIESSFLALPEIIDATYSNTTIIDINNASFAAWEGMNRKEKMLIHELHTSDNFFKFYDLQLIKFPGTINPDNIHMQNSIYVNETALNEIGWKDPIGKTIFYNGETLEVAGVVKDFHFEKLSNEISPLIIKTGGDDFSVISLKISSAGNSQTIEKINRKWKNHYPDNPMYYSFLDEKIKTIYKAEKQLLATYNILTLISIFLSILGLAGLSSFNAERSYREIAVRKVLGATELKLFSLMVIRTLKLVLIGCILAVPGAVIIMSRWLNSFAYRIEIQWWMVSLSTVLTLIITLMAISWQTMQATTANPIKHLNNE